MVLPLYKQRSMNERKSESTNLELFRASDSIRHPARTNWSDAGTSSGEARKERFLTCLCVPRLVNWEKNRDPPERWRFHSNQDVWDSASSLISAGQCVGRNFLTNPNPEISTWNAIVIHDKIMFWKRTASNKYCQTRGPYHKISLWCILIY